MGRQLNAALPLFPVVHSLPPAPCPAPEYGRYWPWPSAALSFPRGLFGIRRRPLSSPPAARRIHANGLFLFAAQQGRVFLALDLIAGLPQQLQQRIKAVGLLYQRIVNGRTDSLPVGGLLFVAQPLVVALAVALRI